MINLLKSKTREAILIATIILIGIIITAIAPAFFTKLNLINLLYSNVVLGVMTMGMMMVIVTGNIDVSVGAQYAVCGMVVALFVKETGGQHVVLSILIGVACGIVLGLLNGILVAKLKIPAIVVTLSTLNIMRGVLYLVSRGNWIDGLKGPFARFASQRVLGLQTAIYIWLAVLIFTYLLLYRTNVGRDVLAVGGNKTAARRLGINETQVYLLAFGYMGALAGLAAAIACSKLKIAQPSNGLGYEMQLIAACVIGGTLFSGGVASVLGTLLGVLLMGVIDNGLVLTKVPVYWQELTTGIIIILAVASGVFKGGNGKKTTRKINRSLANEHQ
ncbi:MAG: ABC transporter permease [Christensenellales bacterium]|jgi:ribose transport system permease protein